MKIKKKNFFLGGRVRSGGGKGSQGGCEQRIEVLVKMKKNGGGGSGGGVGGRVDVTEK